MLVHTNSCSWFVFVVVIETKRSWNIKRSDWKRNKCKPFHPNVSFLFISPYLGFQLQAYTQIAELYVFVYVYSHTYGHAYIKQCLKQIAISFMSARFSYVYVSDWPDVIAVFVWQISGAIGLKAYYIYKLKHTHNLKRMANKIVAAQHNIVRRKDVHHVATLLRLLQQLRSILVSITRQKNIHTPIFILFIFIY